MSSQTTPQRLFSVCLNVCNAERLNYRQQLRNVFPFSIRPKGNSISQSFSLPKLVLPFFQKYHRNMSLQSTTASTAYTIEPTDMQVLQLTRKPKEIFRKDYRPSEYQIKHIAMDIRLSEFQTEVGLF